MPIKREATYIGLKDGARQRYNIIDRDPISRDFFEIVEFPEVLTAGKNVFKFRGDPSNLVQETQIYFEILDYNDDPIYYEVLNYNEKNGVRVISIWIFEDTPEGLATIYLAGRARLDPQNGDRFTYSHDQQSPDYKEYPNILWERATRVKPNGMNKSEMIFLQEPNVEIIEDVKTFAQITDLPTFYNTIYGTASGLGPGGGYSTNTTTVASNINQLFAGAVKAVNNAFLQYNQSAAVSAPVPEAGFSGLTIAKSQGVSKVSYSLPAGLAKSPAVSGTPTTGTGNTKSNIGISNAAAVSNVGLQGPGGTTNTMYAPVMPILNPNELAPAVQTVTTTTFNPADSTTINITNGIAFSGSVHLGGLVIINRPTIIASADHRVDAAGRIVHHAATTDVGNATAGVATEIDSTYVGTISDIQNSTQAKLSPSFDFLTKRTTKPDGHHVIAFEPSPVTMSYWEPMMSQETENSMSFASITLSNIQPATGDVFSIKTSYKLMGAPGDYIDAGQTILEKYDVLQDTGSQVPTLVMGVQDRKYGLFYDQSVIDTYWQSNAGTTTTFDNDILGESVKLTHTPSAMSDTDFVRFDLDPSYYPTLHAGTEYSLQFFHKVVATGSMDPPTFFQTPRIDVYVSGSSIHPTRDYKGTIQRHHPVTPPAQKYFTGTEYGNYLGSIEQLPGTDAQFSVVQFVPLDTLPNNLIFVVRKGEWHLTNVSLQANMETGFSPNFAKMSIRIPTDAMNAPLAFKFQYLNYLSEPAQLQSFIQGAIFDGDNTYIEGQNNLLTGSVFIGNAIGSGIELAGVNSAFIRAIGYEGFTSASAPGNAGGFMIWSGSVLPDSVDDYGGVGLELINDSSSFFKFRTSGSETGLEIVTPSFFLGSVAAGNYISGSGGNIEITSSNFHLQPSGDVIMQGTITAEAGGIIGGASINSHSIAFDPHWEISSSTNTNDPVSFISSSAFKVSADGRMTASAGLIGGWSVTSDRLSTTVEDANYVALVPGTGIQLGDATFEDAPFNVHTSGRMTGSNVLFTGGKIAGMEFDNGKFSVPDIFHISASTVTTDTIGFISSSNFKVSPGGVITASAGLIGGATITDDKIAYMPYWAISSSNNNNLPGSFISSSKFKVRADGTVTASAIQLLGGAIDNSPYWKIDNATNNTPGSFISSSAFKVSTGGEMTASLGKIAGWIIDEDKLSSPSSNIVLDGTNKELYIHNQTFGSTGIQLQYNGGNPKFFVGKEAGQHIKFDATGEGELFLSSSQFFLGSADQYVSGALGNIEISSSGFHLDAEGNAILKGKITANQGDIAGWLIESDKLYNTGITLSSSYGVKVMQDSTAENDNFIEMKYKATDDWGLLGKQSGQETFQLGHVNQIASWSFDNDKIISKMGSYSPEEPGIVLKSEGTIQTNPFISGLTANATGWQIRADGRAEFENAVIRGTLSTAVFEKDTISVVGGQVMVANAAKVDNVNPRFTNYPHLKSAIGENINWSGEVSPTTSSTSYDEDGSLRLASANITASHPGSENLWLRVANTSATNGSARFSISTGSYAPGTKFRATFYSSGSERVSNGSIRNPNFRIGKIGSGGYNPDYIFDGVKTSGFSSAISNGFHVVEFSSSADWNVGPNTNDGAILQFQIGDNVLGANLHLRDLHCMAISQSLVVDNAGGFVPGEYLVAKSTDQGPDGREGFVREYMQVISSSLGKSETPASGTFDFGTTTIDTSTNFIVTASEHYTFTGVASTTPDQIAINQYYFELGATKQHSLTRLKDKIVEEVLDIFAMVTGSADGVTDQIYFQGHGAGVDGNAYGAQLGTTQVKLQGGINRIKPQLTVERNMDARVSGNERGYFIERIKDGQSIASQGSAGTGYILMNAQPTDDYSPYIDIVERQDTTVGTQQHTPDSKHSVFGEVKTLARIGDLGGITDYQFSDGVSGYGIYTSNGYFKGKIEVSSLPVTPPSENLIFHLPLDGKISTGSFGSGSFPDTSGNNYHLQNIFISASVSTGTQTWSGDSVTVNSSSAKIGGSAVFAGTTTGDHKLVYKNIPLRDNHTFAYWMKIDKSDTSQFPFAIDANSSYINPFTGASLNPGTGGAGSNGQLGPYFTGNTIAWNTGESAFNPFNHIASHLIQL